MKENKCCSCKIRPPTHTVYRIIVEEIRALRSLNLEICTVCAMSYRLSGNDMLVFEKIRNVNRKIAGKKKKI